MYNFAEAILSCGFEVEELTADNHKCAFRRVGDPKWILYRGPTPTPNTGPGNDHTKGDALGKL